VVEGKVTVEDAAEAEEHHFGSWIQNGASREGYREKEK
jgi:hypothetical protein